MKRRRERSLYLVKPAPWHTTVAATVNAGGLKTYTAAELQLEVKAAAVAREAVLEDWFAMHHPFMPREVTHDELWARADGELDKMRRQCPPRAGCLSAYWREDAATRAAAKYARKPYTADHYVLELHTSDFLRHPTTTRVIP